LNNIATLDKFATLTEDEMSEVTGGWSWGGAGIAFGLGGVVGLGIYSLYQFGMDQGYNNNKK
jgi:lactobin A/cerein 7B family class IIb bacteriocin